MGLPSTSGVLMRIVVLVIAVLIVLAFALVWLRDRRRTQQQAADSDRLDP